MRATLIINGTDFGPYIAEDGISHSVETRNEKSITTKDGTVYKTNIEVKKLSINLIDGLYDSIITTLFTALKSSNPATVTFNDYVTGESLHSVHYYVSDISYGEKRSYGSITEISGASFTLECMYGSASEPEIEGEAIPISRVDEIYDSY